MRRFAFAKARETVEKDASSAPGFAERPEFESGTAPVSTSSTSAGFVDPCEDSQLSQGSVRPLNSQLFHPGFQGFGIDLQKFGSAFFSADAPAGFFQSFDDVIAFVFLQA